MGHCVRIYFECEAAKVAAFRDIAATEYAEIINDKTIWFADPSSDSNNFVTDCGNCIELDIEVKTPFLSRIFLHALTPYICAVKDCEDTEDERGESLSAFFRC